MCSNVITKEVHRGTQLRELLQPEAVILLIT